MRKLDDPIAGRLSDKYFSKFYMDFASFSDSSESDLKFQILIFFPALCARITKINFYIESFNIF